MTTRLVSGLVTPMYPGILCVSYIKTLSKCLKPVVWYLFWLPHGDTINLGVSWQPSFLIWIIKRVHCLDKNLYLRRDKKFSYLTTIPFLNASSPVSNFWSAHLTFAP